ncbi:MAG: DHH family phosphoesterase, partial [Candidatus Bathyarchaeia archaeon]
LENYRQIITKYLRWLNENPERIEEWENIYVLHGEKDIDEKAISTISTIISMSLPRVEKPLIAYSLVSDEGIIKISARTTDSTARMGLNLGEIIRIAAERCSGIGGGHDIAAGAQVPYNQRNLFLKYVNSLVGEYMARIKKDGG